MRGGDWEPVGAQVESGKGESKVLVVVNVIKAAASAGWQPWS